LTELGNWKRSKKIELAFEK